MLGMEAFGCICFWLLLILGAVYFIMGLFVDILSGMSEEFMKDYPWCGPNPGPGEVTLFSVPPLGVYARNDFISLTRQQERCTSMTTFPGPVHNRPFVPIQTQPKPPSTFRSPFDDHYGPHNDGNNNFMYTNPRFHQQDDSRNQFQDNFQNSARYSDNYNKNYGGHKQQAQPHRGSMFTELPKKWGASLYRIGTSRIDYAQRGSWPELDGFSQFQQTSYLYPSSTQDYPRSRSSGPNGYQEEERNSASRREPEDSTRITSLFSRKGTRGQNFYGLSPVSAPNPPNESLQNRDSPVFRRRDLTLALKGPSDRHFRRSIL